jgi:hypothetical protein
MAGLRALTNAPEGIERIYVAHDTKVGSYLFVSYRDGEWICSIIDDKLYLQSPCWDSTGMQRDIVQQVNGEDNKNVYRKTYQTDSKAILFSQCKDQNETWVPFSKRPTPRPRATMRHWPAAGSARVSRIFPAVELLRF